MAIQELNLTIKHQSGRSNASADARSRNPVREGETPKVCAVEVSHVGTDPGGSGSSSFDISEDTKQKLANSGNLRTGYSNAILGSRARYLFLYIRSHDHDHGHRVALQSQRVAEAAVKTLN